MDAKARERRTALTRTAKSCGPDARRWRHVAMMLRITLLRANGSGECPPDDRLREAIQDGKQELDCFVAPLIALTNLAASQ